MSPEEADHQAGDHSNGECYVDGGVGESPQLPDGLLRLWAPYRSAYLTTEEKVDDPFLEIPKKSDEDGLIVARGETVYCVLNLFPYNPGHMMVIPYRQVADYSELTDDETAELSLFTKRAIRTLRRASHPDALNVGMNLGRASGGSVPHHLHQHVVPRWIGDASFMTVISGSKVLPQVLQETRQLLASAWQDVVEEESAKREA